MQTEKTKDNGTKAEDTDFCFCNPENFQKMFEKMGNCFVGQDEVMAIKILKLLPKTNCRECGQATCMVFAKLMVDGVKGHEECPAIDEFNRKKLSEYMSQFRFDI